MLRCPFLEELLPTVLDEKASCLTREVTDEEIYSAILSTDDENLLALMVIQPSSLSQLRIL